MEAPHVVRRFDGRGGRAPPNIPELEGGGDGWPGAAPPGLRLLSQPEHASMKTLWQVPERSRDIGGFFPGSRRNARSSREYRGLFSVCAFHWVETPPLPRQNPPS